jgi:hypothetical protein
MTRRLLALLGTVAATFLVFLVLVRPWYLRWGATDYDTLRSLPGDEIIPDAVTQETRAITIAAPIERVWPWVAQLGQDRGGFYSFDLLENLVGCEMPTVDVLRPAAQEWRLGDKLWMYPPSKAGGIGFATLRTYLPGRALGFATHAVGTPVTAPEDGSWSFFLEPTLTGETRLLIRGRGAPGRALGGVIFDRLVFEPVHFVMERRTMLGLKELAEGSSRTRVLNHLQVLLWALTFGLIVASAALVLRTADGSRALGALVVGCLLFQVLTLAQPPFVLGAISLVALAGLVPWVTARRSSPPST